MMRLSAAQIRDLTRLCPGGVARDVPLSEISRWRIGGTADLILRPSGPDEVASLRDYMYRRGMRHVVMGETSNLLFSDEGLHVPCIQIGRRMGGVVISGPRVTVGAGTWVPALARAVMWAGLAGVEHICGIPGTLGGLICMNGGSQRKGIGSVVVSVATIGLDGRETIHPASDCGFAYRASVFQHTQEIVTAARLHLHPGDRRTIRREMLTILTDRRRKFPRAQPNCGSVFKSNPAMYAKLGPPGAVIERLGFKGYRIGGAQVSPDHANFIVNAGGARASDVTALIARISDTVRRETGHRLGVEVQLVTPSGDILPADTDTRLEWAMP